VLGPLGTTLDLAVTTRSTHAQHQSSLESPVLGVEDLVLIQVHVIGGVTLAVDLLVQDCLAIVALAVGIKTVVTVLVDSVIRIFDQVEAGREVAFVHVPVLVTIVVVALVTHVCQAVPALTVRTTGIVPAVVETIIVVIIPVRRHRPFGLVVVLGTILLLDLAKHRPVPEPRVRGHRAFAIQHTAQGLDVLVLVALQMPIAEQIPAQVRLAELGFHLVDGLLLLSVHLFELVIQRPGTDVSPLRRAGSDPDLAVDEGPVRHGRNHSELTPLRPLQVLDHDLTRTHGQPLGTDHTALPLTLVPVAALPAATASHPIVLLAIVEHPELHLSDRRSSDITSERTTCACRAVVLQLVLDFVRNVLGHLHLDRLAHGQSEDHAGCILEVLGPTKRLGIDVDPLVNVVTHVSRGGPVHGVQPAWPQRFQSVAAPQVSGDRAELQILLEATFVNLQISVIHASSVAHQVRELISEIRVRVVLFSRVALVETKCGRSCHENSTSSGELGVSLGIRCISAKLHSSEDVGAGFSLPPWRAKARPYIYTLMESQTNKPSFVL